MMHICPLIFLRWFEIFEAVLTEKCNDWGGSISKRGLRSHLPSKKQSNKNNESGEICNMLVFIRVLWIYVPCFFSVIFQICLHQQTSFLGRRQQMFTHFSHPRVSRDNYSNFCLVPRKSVLPLSSEGVLTFVCSYLSVISCLPFRSLLYVLYLLFFNM